MTTEVILRYRYRLYPTVKQQVALAKAFGCARVVYNDGLRLREEAYRAGRPLAVGDIQKIVVTRAKQTPERAWLGEVSSGVLIQAVNDLHRAYAQFFASVTGRRPGPRVGPPRFKSKKNPRQMIRFTRSARFSITKAGRLRLPKIGDVEVRWSRVLPSSPSSVAVTVDAAGRYHANFVVRLAPMPLPRVQSDIGVDLGLVNFAVLSNGEKVDNPRWLRSRQRQLARGQRALCRKKKGSNNRKKAVRKVAKLHANVADARKDYLQKLSTRLIRENQAIYVENLSVRGLARTHVSRSVHDAGWSMFVNMLEYKAGLYGRTLGKVDRWHPSTRTCNECGRLGDKLPLNVRSWSCPCGAVHDRDVNAAKNVLVAGRANSLNACGGDVSPPLAVAVAGEAGIHRGAASAPQGTVNYGEVQR